jgi:hypothetical protein
VRAALPPLLWPLAADAYLATKAAAELRALQSAAAPGETGLHSKGVAKLGIHLQNGFDDDEVVVTIDGEERLHRHGVRTKRLLGLAEHTQIDVADGPISVTVSVPNRGLKHVMQIEPGTERNVGISITPDGIRTMAQNERFGYG